MKNRQYLKRVIEFTGPSKSITQKDKNGLYVTKDDSYVKNYFNERENIDDDGNFLSSMAMGYMMDDGIVGGLMGGNLLGGMIGDMLNLDDDSNVTPVNTDTDANWPDDSINQPQQDSTSFDNQNFS